MHHLVDSHAFSAAGFFLATAVAAAMVLGWSAAAVAPWWCTGLAITGLVFSVIALTRRSEGLGWLCVALSWIAWQLAGMGWVALAVRDGAHQIWWQSLVLAVLLAFQIVPLLICWGLLGWAGRVGPRAWGRSPGWLAWRFGLTLACTETLRQTSWWGSGYAGLSTLAVDVPGAHALIPVLGGAGWALVLWAACTCLALAAWHALSGARRLPMWYLGAAAAISIVAGFWPAKSWTAEMTTSVAAVAVPAPAAQNKQWTVQDRDHGLEQLEQAIARSRRGSVIVTSESFFLLPPPRETSGRWGDLVRRARKAGQHLLIGMPFPVREDDGIHLINAAVQISPDRSSVYGKERLVPGGEYLPWAQTLGPVYARLFNDTSEGQHPSPPEYSQVLFADGSIIGASICHELAFPLTMIERAANANWLANLSSDSWIDSDLYRGQMITLGRLRAMETGKPLLRVSQAGPSMLVSPSGEVTSLLTHDHASGEVAITPTTGITPYTSFGPLLAWAPLVLLALCCVASLFWPSPPPSLDTPS